MSSKLHRNVCIFITASLLFVNFWLNPLAIASPSWVASFNLDTESWVLGRIIQSRQKGIFSFSGFLGQSLPASGETVVDNPAHLQYQAYFNDENLPNFSFYTSQPGTQGWLFSLLDGLLRWVSPGSRLQIFYALNCLLLSLVVTAIAAWFVREVGHTAGVGVVLSCLTAQWLEVFAPKIFWSTWAFFLPMAAVMWMLPSGGALLKSTSRLATVVFAAVLVKTLFNGFEFETAFLVTLFCPLVYCAAVGHWSFSQAGKAILAVSLGACSAIIVGLSILIIQSAALTGVAESGVHQIIYALLKRTYPIYGMIDPIYLERMNLSTFGLIRFYLDEYFAPGVSFKAYLITTVLCTLELILAQRREGKFAQNGRLNAVLLSTWISLLGPLSWFIIFKAHCVIHVHMDPFVWQLPFTIFGAALLGLAIQDVSARLIQAISPFTKIRFNLPTVIEQFHKKEDKFSS